MVPYASSQLQLQVDEAPERYPSEHQLQPPPTEWKWILLSITPFRKWEWFLFPKYTSRKWKWFFLSKSPPRKWKWFLLSKKPPRKWKWFLFHKYTTQNVIFSCPKHLAPVADEMVLELLEPHHLPDLLPITPQGRPPLQNNLSHILSGLHLEQKNDT